MKKVPLKAWPEECSMPKNGGSLQRSRFLGTYPQGVIFFDVLLVFGSGLGGGGNIIIRVNQDRMDHMKFLVSLGANVGKHELMWGDHIRNHFHFFLQIWESHKYLEIRVTN